jgi:hypothetical protein
VANCLSAEWRQLGLKMHGIVQSRQPSLFTEIYIKAAQPCYEWQGSEHVRCTGSRQIQQSAHYVLVTWGSGIRLAGNTRFSWVNSTAGSLRHCLTSLTRNTPNTKRCPTPNHCERQDCSFNRAC